MTIRRFLSLWLPRLTTDRARRAQRVDPLRAAGDRRDASTNARRLVGVDATAARLGLSPGLTLADARARHPALVVCEADPPAEAKLLERLADFCSRFTPLVALDGADGLMLDVSGVAHLFGGEEGLVAEVEARLSRLGLTVALGLADAPRAAWALARFSNAAHRPRWPLRQGLRQALSRHAGRRAGARSGVVRRLARAGLRRIGDLAMRPRAPIAARFGAETIARLDALNGETREAISPRFPAARFLRRAALRQPDRRPREAVMATLPKLADDLAALLERHAKGARRLELTAVSRRRRRAAHSRRRRTAAQSRRAAMARLFAERLAGGGEEEIDAGFGVDLMRLACLARRAARAGRRANGSALEEADRRGARSPISSTASARGWARGG